MPNLTVTIPSSIEAVLKELLLGAPTGGDRSQQGMRRFDGCRNVERDGTEFAHRLVRDYQ